MIRKTDIILFVSLFAAALLLLGVGVLCRHDAKIAVITENGTEVCRLSLEKDAEISLSHNTVRVENGRVFVKEADCDNQLCVKTPPISKTGEIIVCLPNKVTVEVKDEG